MYMVYVYIIVARVAAWEAEGGIMPNILETVYLSYGLLAWKHNRSNKIVLDSL